MKSLRIVYMGTPGFAVAGLDKLHQSHHEIVAVITAPDRPAGRGRKLRASEVKEYALEHELPVLQPVKLRDEKFLSELKTYHADLFVVIAFRMLPELVWAMPEMGTINVHASLLPNYRGAAPINWALMNGEEKTGVSTFFIDAHIDEGKLIDQATVDIDDDDNVGSLHDRLMARGAELLLDTVNRIADGTAQASSQEVDGLKLHKAPKLNSENRKIDWTRSAKEIRNHIRGLSPYPSAWSELYLGDEAAMMCKLYASEFIDEENAIELKPGEIATDDKTYIYVGTGTFALALTEWQPSGKRRMSTREILNGVSIPAGSHFS